MISMNLFMVGVFHALIGAAFVQVFTRYRPIYGFVGGMLPDIDGIFIPFDLGFPLVHRGITHTLVFLIVVVFTLWWLRFPEPLIHGFGIGTALHLLLDATSAWGAPLLWPISSENVLIYLDTHGWAQVVMLVTLLVAIIVSYPQKRRFEKIQ